MSYVVAEHPDGSVDILPISPDLPELISTEFDPDLAAHIRQVLHKEAVEPTFRELAGDCAHAWANWLRPSARSSLWWAADGGESGRASRSISGGRSQCISHTGNIAALWWFQWLRCRRAISLGKRVQPRGQTTQPNRHCPLAATSGPLGQPTVMRTGVWPGAVPTDRYT